MRDSVTSSSLRMTRRSLTIQDRDNDSAIRHLACFIHQHQSAPLRFQQPSCGIACHDHPRRPNAGGPTPPPPPPPPPPPHPPPPPRTTPPPAKRTPFAPIIAPSSIRGGVNTSAALSARLGYLIFVQDTL